MIATFELTWEDFRKHLRDAGQGGPRSVLALAAHRHAGSSAVLGLTELEPSLRKLEAACNDDAVAQSGRLSSPAGPGPDRVRLVASSEFGVERLMTGPAHLTQRPARPWEKSRVLCIEDDPIVQLMLRDVVGGAGAECSVVSSAREAEAKLSGGGFDLVLLDRKLPDSDGLLLLQSIKKSNNCPVVVLSAMDETRDKLLGLGLGAEEYITKPFNPLELSSRITAASERSRRQEVPVRERTLRGRRFVL